ncbi:hypothetical protein GCM10023205_74460 [Yinghuangia aomiensis]|uniref:Uncharacterized protein n=1 Tax=Yinghuangia aomiensis TaxID=676205 RepID=A0ABP9I8T2_9ACTN
MSRSWHTVFAAALADFDAFCSGDSELESEHAAPAARTATTTNDAHTGRFSTDYSHSHDAEQSINGQHVNRRYISGRN